MNERICKCVEDALGNVASECEFCANERSAFECAAYDRYVRCETAARNKRIADREAANARIRERNEDKQRRVELTNAANSLRGTFGRMVFEPEKERPALNFAPLFDLPEFAARSSNGQYQVPGVDSAWWGWRARARILTEPRAEFANAVAAYINSGVVSLSSDVAHQNELRAQREQFEAECASLAASACPHVIGDDHGHASCARDGKMLDDVKAGDVCGWHKKADGRYGCGRCDTSSNDDIPVCEHPQTLRALTDVKLGDLSRTVVLDKLRYVASYLDGNGVEHKMVETPIPMLLFCPACLMQHIDAPDATHNRRGGLHSGLLGDQDVWTNPPHKTHLCHYCGHKWRPCAYPTAGVKLADSGLTQEQGDACDPRGEDQARRGNTWHNRRTAPMPKVQ